MSVDHHVLDHYTSFVCTRSVHLRASKYHISLIFLEIMIVVAITCTKTRSKHEKVNLCSLGRLGSQLRDEAEKIYSYVSARPGGEKYSPGRAYFFFFFHFLNNYL